MFQRMEEVKILKGFDDVLKEELSEEVPSQNKMNDVLPAKMKNLEEQSKKREVQEVRGGGGNRGTPSADCEHLSADLRHPKQQNGCLWRKTP